MVRYIGSPGSHHLDFTEWCRAQGVDINGVAATKCSDEGIGITAARDLQTGESIVTVPTSALLTAQTIPLSFREKFPPTTSVQTLVAAYLCCDGEARGKYAAWEAVWPSMQDFEGILPLIWPEYLNPRENPEDTPLPPALSGIWNSLYRAPIYPSTDAEGRNLLARQDQRLRDAYATVRMIFPDTEKEDFTYYWIVVNTRSASYLRPGYPLPEDRSDAMALGPFADYFNHSDDGCEVIYDSERYIFKTTRPYQAGEEIYLTYGHHSTDVLWTEYGFVPNENRWDSLSLDDIIFNELGAEHIELLKETDYLGNYHLTSSGPCFRTEVAATLTYLSPDDWRQYVAGGRPPPPGYDISRTNAVTARWIRRYIEEAKASLLKITELRARLGVLGEDKRFHTIIHRWRLIIELAHEALGSMTAMTSPL